MNPAKKARLRQALALDRLEDEIKEAIFDEAQRLTDGWSKMEPLDQAHKLQLMVTRSLHLPDTDLEVLGRLLARSRVCSRESFLKTVQKARKEADGSLDESPKKGDRVVFTAVLPGLVDLVKHNGNPAFLVKDRAELSILPQIERDGVVYTPPPKEQIPWLLPRGEEVLKLYELQKSVSQRERDGALYDDLLSYHKAISELPEEYYDLIVAWDFHTYLLEPVQYSPIICLFAVPERGKSRTGKGMIHVAYRGIHVESLRDAYLVRVANDLRASVFFDVKDIWQKAVKSGTEDILLHRFEKGAKVPRVLFPDRGAHRDIVYYSVFGPTVIATNEGVHRILETRAVPINMPETSKRFENDVTPEVSLPLKERLIVFRAMHLGETFTDIAKPAVGRLGDILRPLQQIIRLVKPEREESFLKLVKALEAEKLLEKADSLEAQILVTLIRLEGQVDKGILPVKAITDCFNEGKSEKSRITYQRVGRRLAAMGFKKARAGDGASAIIWDEKNIERMKETYGLGKTSVTSGLGIDVSDDTDVFRNPVRGSEGDVPDDDPEYIEGLLRDAPPAEALEEGDDKLVQGGELIL